MKWHPIFVELCFCRKKTEMSVLFLDFRKYAVPLAVSQVTTYFAKE